MDGKVAKREEKMFLKNCGLTGRAVRPSQESYCQLTVLYKKSIRISSDKASNLPKRDVRFILLK